MFKTVLLILIMGIFSSSKCDTKNPFGRGTDTTFQPLVEDLGEVREAIPETKDQKLEENLKTGCLECAVNDYVEPENIKPCHDFILKDNALEESKEEPEVIATIENEEEVMVAETEVLDTDQTILDQLSFEDLTSAPPPHPQCNQGRYGYDVKFGWSNWKKFCKGLDSILNTPIGKKADVPCQISHCTTASFLAIVQVLKRRSDFPKLKKDIACKTNKDFGKMYAVFNGAHPNGGIGALFDKFNLGKVEKVSANKNSLLEKENLFKRGTPLLIQRSKRNPKTYLRGSGHSVIFDQFKKRNGKITAICYWSSNKGTGGSGKQCEVVNEPFHSSYYVGVFNQ